MVALPVEPTRRSLRSALATGRLTVVITTIVLIKADPKHIPETAREIAGVDGVQEVYSVSGEWDLVAIVRVDAYEKIAEVVTERFPAVAGTIRTQTLTAFRAYSRGDVEQAWDFGGG